MSELDELRVPPGEESGLSKDIRHKKKIFSPEEITEKEDLLKMKILLIVTITFLITVTVAVSSLGYKIYVQDKNLHQLANETSEALNELYSGVTPLLKDSMVTEQKIKGLSAQIYDLQKK